MVLYRVCLALLSRVLFLALITSFAPFAITVYDVSRLIGIRSEFEYGIRGLWEYGPPQIGVEDSEWIPQWYGEAIYHHCDTSFPHLKSAMISGYRRRQ